MARDTAWPREVWLDALWDSESLTPYERVVAHVFARYAGAGATSWCSWPELLRRTGIRSRTTIAKAISGLVDGKWMVEVAKARQHYSARYRLTIPPEQSTSWTSGDVQESTRRTAEDGQESTSRTAEPVAAPIASSPSRDTSSPSPDTSSPSRGPDISNGELQQRTPTGGHAAPRTPLRPRAPSGLGTEEDLSPPVSGHDQNELIKNHLPARADNPSPVDRRARSPGSQSRNAHTRRKRRRSR